MQRKSTISEDIVIIREVLSKLDMGKLKQFQEQQVE